MKKILTFLTLMFALGNCAAFAWTSDDDYVPFVREGSEWGYQLRRYTGEPAFFSNDLEKNYIYYIKGDTILNGVTYKKLYAKGIMSFYNQAEDRYYKEMTDKPYVALREENKVVYGVALDTIDFDGCADLYFDNRVHGTYYDLNKEGILYDFSDVRNFMINKCVAVFGGEPDSYPVGVEIGENPSVLAPDRSVFIINYIGKHWLIEGVGMLPHHWGDITQWAFAIRACFPQSGGLLMYMRNADGGYEYLAEGLEVSEVETIRSFSDECRAYLQGRQLTFSVPPHAVPGMVEVISAEGRVARSSIVLSENADLSLADLPAGIYVVRICSKLFNHSTKIILR